MKKVNKYIGLMVFLAIISMGIMNVNADALTLVKSKTTGTIGTDPIVYLTVRGPYSSDSSLVSQTGDHLSTSGLDALDEKDIGGGMGTYTVRAKCVSAGSSFLTAFVYANRYEPRSRPYFEGEYKIQITCKAAATQKAKVTSLFDIIGSKVGKQATLWAKVQSTGTKSLDSSCTTRYWVTGPGINRIVGGTSVTVGTGANKGLLAPGKTRWSSFSWTPGTKGTYTYWAAVYCNNERVSAWSSGKKFVVKNAVKNQVNTGATKMATITEIPENTGAGKVATITWIP